MAAAAAAAAAAMNNARRRLKDLPVLGEQDEFLTWLPRLERRMRVLGYEDMLDPNTGPTAMPHNWPNALEGIMDSVTEADRQVIMSAGNYIEAVAMLKAIHIPSIELAQYHKRHEFNSLALGPTESVVQLVSRARTLGAHLALLGRTVTDEQVLDAVTSALSKNPRYADQLATLVSIQPAGQTITIPLLIKAFGSMPSNRVPGAMLAKEAKPAVKPTTPPVSPEMKEVMKVFMALASRVQENTNMTTNMALSLTAKNPSGGAPSPAPDRAGKAAQHVHFNPYVQQDGQPRTEPYQDSTRGRGAPRGHRRGNDGRARGGRGNRGGRGRWEGHRSPADRDEDRDRSPAPTVRYCLNCQSPDHAISDCRENCTECGSLDHLFPSCPGNRGCRKWNPNYRYTKPVPPPPAHHGGAQAYHAEHSREFGECNFAMGAQYVDDSLPFDMPSPYSGAWHGRGDPMDVDQGPGFANMVMAMDMDYAPPPGFGRASAYALTVQSKEPSRDWILDSGATHHVTPHLDQLHDVEWDVLLVHLIVANSQYILRKAVGSMHVATMFEGITYQRTIPNV